MVHEIRWFVMVVLLIFGGISQASAAVTLRYAEAGPNRGTRAEAVQFFADEVERLSSGNLIIDIHWGGRSFEMEWRNGGRLSRKCRSGQRVVFL